MPAPSLVPVLFCAQGILLNPTNLSMKFGKGNSLAPVWNIFIRVNLKGQLSSVAAEPMFSSAGSLLGAEQLPAQGSPCDKGIVIPPSPAPLQVTTDAILSV